MAASVAEAKWRSGNNDGWGLDDAANAPPSRFVGEGAILPPIAVNRHGPAVGSLREMTPRPGDGEDRRIKGLGLVGDRRIGEEDCPPPSSGGKQKS